MSAKSLKSMTNNKSSIIILVIINILLLTLSFNDTGAVDRKKGSFIIRIEQFPEEAPAGDPLLITLMPEGKVKSVAGECYGNRVYFFKRNGKDNTFYAFLGTDVNQKESRTMLKFTINYSDGISTDYIYNVKVKEIVYPEENIKVPKKMVQPPSEMAKRIMAEREQVLDVYSESEPREVFDSAFIMPLNTEISSSFGRRRKYNGIKKSPHTGIDLKGVIGRKIKSSNGGKVVLARELYFTGNTVIIDHGLGLFSAYFHLDTVKKGEGESVKRGETIGTVGMTGRVTGPHLHFGVRLNGFYVNPASFISLTEKFLSKKNVTAKNDTTE